MRFSVLAAAALSAAAVRADADPAEDASASKPVVSRPEFTPTTLKAPFLEQFTDDWEKRWKPSHAKKKIDDTSSEEEWAYVGNWAVEEPTVYKGIDGDKGLVIKDKAAHHAISAKFAKPISNKKNSLVVQYEVKLQDSLECGGAYLKLLQDNKALHAEEFSNASPYIIMFGPDKCGSTNKVHFIFRHKNPKTGEYEEKHMDSPPSAKIVKTTTLYTLIVRPDQTFEIKIDGESAKNGSLFEDFTPSVNPPTEIDDPKDTKPDDWVDDARIADPEATKPEDWDEDAPYEIVDDEATKPDDWLEDEPSTINDPEAEKPEDWDDEEDGDWVAPKVPNPKCDEVSGCGPWKKPMKTNPDYKGKWTAPFIDNPAYKGVWAPRKIKNPNYFEDKNPANFEPMGAIGFEIWTMQNDILFDNIYIGHSEEDAAALQKETFDIKAPIEKQQEEADKPVIPDPVPETGDFKADPVKYIRSKLDGFWTLFKSDPVSALKTMPEVAGAIGATIVTIITLLVTVLGFGAGAAPSKEQLKSKATEAKNKAAAAKDKAAEAVSTAAEHVKDSASKRQTRSAASE